MSNSQNGVNGFAVAAVAMAACLAFAVQAQMPDPGMPPPYQPPPDPYAAPAPEKGAFKKMFAGTLAAVLQTTGAGLATGLATVMTGAIQNWFNKPPKAAPGYAGDAAAASMGGMTPGSMGGGMPGSATPGMPTTTTDPMGGTPSSGGMGGMPMGGMPTGDMGMPQSTMPSGMPPATTGLVAGLAYEVQLQGRDGQVLTVDPATHYFATGDRFVVMYRPSLPGQVAIYNVNPLGQEKLIDSVNVAAGELTRLGPYEFRHNTGTEVLRLILSPCRNDGLMATTRDIVKVDEMASPMASSPPSGGLMLQDCAIVASRSVRPETRDIVKVGAEDGTMFALDPITQQEMQAGNFTPRELTLTFNHR